MKDIVYILLSSFEGSVSVVSVFRKKEDALALKFRYSSIYLGIYFYIEEHELL